MAEARLKPGYTMRPAVMSDGQAVYELVAAVTMASSGEIEETLEDITSLWTRTTIDPARNTRVVIDPDGKYIVYAALADDFSPGTPFVVAYIHPDLQDSDGTIGAAVMAWIEARVGENISLIPSDQRLAMRAFANTTDERYIDLLTRTGFTPIRHSFRMVIDLDAPPDVPPMPEGIALRTSEPDDDWTPIVQAYLEIWRDHFGFVERPLEGEIERWKTIREKDYRPGYWLLAMDGEAIAGIAINFDQFNGDEAWGYVSTLGVKRDYRRKGVAMALLRRSFARFYADGKRHAALYVDGSSLTGATRLYEAAGMHADQTRTLFEKVLRPGFDPSTQKLA